MLSDKLKFGQSFLNKFSFWRTTNIPLLGLDISNTSVKMVELSHSGSGRHIQIEHYAIEPLPKDAVSEGNLTNLDSIASTIHRAWSRLGTSSRTVAVAIPTAMAVYKKLLIPTNQINMLDAFIEAEASQMIPFPLSEVNIDYQILGPSAASIHDIEVFLCAARKEKVEERAAVVELAGLKAQLVDVDSFVIMGSLAQIQQQLPQQGLDQTFAVFDIGATRTACSVVRNGNLLYHREQEFGGQQLTWEIQRRYGMSLDEAERGKRTHMLPDNYNTGLLQPFVDNLAQEIQRALQFFYTMVSLGQYQRVDYVVLAGGCSMLSGLEAAVSKQTQITTLIANPFCSMDHARNVDTKLLGIDAPALMVACGLALRRFD